MINYNNKDNQRQLKTENDIISILTQQDVPNPISNNGVIDIENRGNNKNLKVQIATWNLWSIPFSSPRTFSNPRRCANYLKNLAQTEKWNEFNGLIIVCLQEIWAWRVGWFCHCFLQKMEYIETIPCIGTTYMNFHKLRFEATTHIWELGNSQMYALYVDLNCIYKENDLLALCMFL